MLSLKQLCVEELYKQLHQGNKEVIEGIQKHFPTELLPHFRGFQSLHQRMCESYPKTLTSRQLVELIKSLKFQKDFERLSVKLNHQFNFSHSELDDEL